MACGLSENAKPAHLCQKKRDKGAFFRSTKSDVFYTVCVKFPTKRQLCAPKQEAKAGTLYVNKITSNIPGKHKVTWFVEGKKVGDVRLQRSRGSRPAGDVGFDTATEDTAVAAMSGDEVLYESLLGLSEKEPQHATALLGEVERAVGAAGGWEEIDAVAVGVGPGSFTGLRVGIATARALGLSRSLDVRGVGTLEALGRGLDGRGGVIRLPVLDARRGEVFAAASPGGPPGLGAVRLPARGARRSDRRPRRAALCAGSGAVRFRKELAGPTSRFRRRRSRPPDRRPAHLRAGGGRGWSRGRARRPELSEASRRGTVA